VKVLLVPGGCNVLAYADWAPSRLVQTIARTVDVSYNDTMKTLCAILVFAVLTAAWLFRYDVVSTGPLLVLDRWTGSVVVLTSAGKTRRPL
jgi:hypothetical protein